MSSTSPEVWSVFGDDEEPILKDIDYVKMKAVVDADETGELYGEEDETGKIYEP
jgi:hypothetical protein